MDPVHPRHDRPVIERALKAHLEALGLSARPCVWAEDARTGYSIVADYALPAAQATIRNLGGDVVEDAVDAAEATTLIMARDPEWEIAMDAAWNAFKHAVGKASSELTMNVAMDAVRIGAASAVTSTSWCVAKNAVEGAVRLTSGPAGSGGVAWDAAWAGAYDGVWIAAFQCVEAVLSIDAAGAIDDPTAARLVASVLPLVDAFEAGLFLFWITSGEVVCVPRPSLWIANDRLHRADGPAVVWPSGERHCFWRGVHIPTWIIEEPHRIAVEAIRSEPNQEIRRCMTEIYGLARYLRDAGARLVHQDEYGKLWEAQVGEEIWRIVEVENGTPEPDGTRRIYTLNVTDAEQVLGWPVETARAAVAATYGLREAEYFPEVRT